jgi:hypothetical protein
MLRVHLEGMLCLFLLSIGSYDNEAEGSGAKQKAALNDKRFASRTGLVI